MIKNVTDIFYKQLELVNTSGIVILLNKESKKYLVTYSRNITQYMTRLSNRFKDLDLPKDLLTDIGSGLIDIQIEEKNRNTKWSDLRLYSVLKMIELDTIGYTSYSNHKPVSYKIQTKKRYDPYLDKDIYDICLLSGRYKSKKIHTCIGLESYNQFLSQNQIQHLIQKLLTGV